jgi:hypothetical protein
LAAVLAHSGAGVTLELHCQSGDRLIVADRRLDAHLNTCQLRAALLAPARLGLPHVADAVRAVSVHAGLHDLGAGVYARGDERWLATYLPADVLVDLFASNPFHFPDESIAVSLRPDVELGATAVRITAPDPRHAWRLDEVALWATSTCAVEELVRGLGYEMSHR